MLNKKIFLLALSGVAVFLLPGCSLGNKIGQYGQDVQTSLGNISVKSTKNAGTLKTTNGNVDIGRHAKVKSVEVINGNVTIGNFSQAVSLQTTNGNILVSENVLINGNVKTTNGNIRINGRAEIGASIITDSGDIFIAQGVTVMGDIIFNKSGFLLSQFKKELPILEIANEVTIKGKIHLYREIDLRLGHSIDPEKILHHYDDRK
ncbi:hypothetical protein [Shewanella sp.]|uniref:DUF4097 family beta strand repeat-containing protein n=1 Tax=Shewanella sp. TaxID=50422 RepID=UPI001EBD891F|nr:hypothetical protein [Shewanella sp.]NRB25855.1 DUF4097 family beta strand repeat protein [Shewanella sp.]